MKILKFDHSFVGTKGIPDLQWRQVMWVYNPFRVICNAIRESVRGDRP